ncbi:MAG TPA: hypothetical protein VF507_04660 [Pyrinomonadaceae bacterium]|jgi:hypothetical protein
MPRHPNGQGRIYDDAEVDRAAYLDRQSVARHKARVRSGHIFGSTVEGSTFISDYPDITDSTLDCHSVSGRAVLLRCGLGSGVEVWGDARLTDVIITGPVLIYGDAELVGPWELSTGFGARIPTGVWTRPPRTLKMLRFSVTEGVGGAWIGCRRKPYSEWFARGPAIGRRMGFSDEEVKELGTAFEEWQASPPLIAHPLSTRPKPFCNEFGQSL